MTSRGSEVPADYVLGMPATPTFVDDHHLRVGDTEFYCDYPLDDVPSGLLPVMKRRDLVERYIRLAESLHPAVVVELGVHRGGSTALLHELTAPEKLIAIELDPTPPQLLVDFVDGRDLGDAVRAFYGVDQADRDRVTRILDDEVADRPIDLVIDDASHLYTPTLSSFETLFPRLRPDGLFVLEDWNADQLLSDEVFRAFDDPTHPWHGAALVDLPAAREALRQHPDSRPTPFLQLVVELILARASAGDVVRDVRVDEHWVVVRRGADPLDPREFRLSDLVTDHVGFTAR